MTKQQCIDDLDRIRASVETAYDVLDLIIEDIDRLMNLMIDSGSPKLPFPEQVGEDKPT